MFCSVKPIPAAAQPEYEFSIEMTTGMSAPPMGMMMRTPIRKPSAVISQNQSARWPVTKTTPMATMAMAMARLNQC